MTHTPAARPVALMDRRDGFPVATIDHGHGRRVNLPPVPTAEDRARAVVRARLAGLRAELADALDPATVEGDAVARAFHVLTIAARPRV